MQSTFTLAAAALILEQVRRAIRGRPAEEDIRNELLKARILFHLAASTIFHVVALTSCGQYRSISREKPWK